MSNLQEDFMTVNLTSTRELVKNTAGVSFFYKLCVQDVLVEESCVSLVYKD